MVTIDLWEKGVAKKRRWANPGEIKVPAPHHTKWSYVAIRLNTERCVLRQIIINKNTYLYRIHTCRPYPGRINKCLCILLFCYVLGFSIKKFLVPAQQLEFGGLSPWSYTSCFFQLCWQKNHPIGRQKRETKYLSSISLKLSCGSWPAHLRIGRRVHLNY